MKWRNTTRGGYPVRIYAEDGAEKWTIHGAVFLGGGWQVEFWETNGAAFFPSRDLVPLTPIIDWSAQPAWCKAVARGSSGEWYRFTVAPFTQDGKWCIHDGDFAQPMHPSEYPALDGDWKDSLCVRPEGGAA